MMVQLSFPSLLRRRQTKQRHVFRHGTRVSPGMNPDEAWQSPGAAETEGPCGSSGSWSSQGTREETRGPPRELQRRVAGFPGDFRHVLISPLWEEATGGRERTTKRRSWQQNSWSSQRAGNVLCSDHPGWIGLAVGNWTLRRV